VSKWWLTFKECCLNAYIDGSMDAKHPVNVLVSFQTRDAVCYVHEASGEAFSS
jgi:hypothetical protein